MKNRLSLFVIPLILTPLSGCSKMVSTEVTETQYLACQQLFQEKSYTLSNADQYTINEEGEKTNFEPPIERVDYVDEQNQIFALEYLDYYKVWFKNPNPKNSSYPWIECTAADDEKTEWYCRESYFPNIRHQYFPDYSDLTYDSKRKAYRSPAISDSVSVQIEWYYFENGILTKTEVEYYYDYPENIPLAHCSFPITNFGTTVIGIPEKKYWSRLVLSSDNLG